MKNSYTAKLFKTGGGSASIENITQAIVPNTGTFDGTVYFNDSLTDDELLTLIDSIPVEYLVDQDESYKEYAIMADILDGDINAGILFMKGELEPGKSAIIIGVESNITEPVLIYQTGQGWLQNSVKFKGELIADFTDPNYPEYSITIGKANNKLINLCHIKKGEKILLSDVYDGSKLVTDQNKIDLRPLINEKKIPLDIETPAPATIKDLIKGPIPNSGEFNNTIYFNTSLTFDELSKLLADLPAEHCVVMPPIKMYMIAGTTINNVPESLVGWILRPKSNVSDEMELVISAMTVGSNFDIYNSTEGGWLKDKVNIKGTLASEVLMYPDIPESLIPAGGANNQLLNLCYTKINNEIKLNGEYEGAAFNTKETKINLRSFINNKHIPLDISVETETPNISVAKIPIPNTGNLNSSYIHFNDKITTEELDALWAKISPDSIAITRDESYYFIYLNETTDYCLFLIRYLDRYAQNKVVFELQAYQGNTSFSPGSGDKSPFLCPTRYGYYNNVLWNSEKGLSEIKLNQLVLDLIDNAPILDNLHFKIGHDNDKIIDFIWYLPAASADNISITSKNLDGSIIVSDNCALNLASIYKTNKFPVESFIKPTFTYKTSRIPLKKDLFLKKLMIDNLMMPTSANYEVLILFESGNTISSYASCGMYSLCYNKENQSQITLWHGLGDRTLTAEFEINEKIIWINPLLTIWPYYYTVEPEITDTYKISFPFNQFNTTEELINYHLRDKSPHDIVRELLPQGCVSVQADPVIRTEFKWYRGYEILRDFYGDSEHYSHLIFTTKNWHKEIINYFNTNTLIFPIYASEKDKNYAVYFKKTEINSAGFQEYALYDTSKSNPIIITFSEDPTCITEPFDLAVLESVGTVRSVIIDGISYDVTPYYFNCLAYTSSNQQPYYPDWPGGITEPVITINIKEDQDYYFNERLHRWIKIVRE